MITPTPPIHHGRRRGRVLAWTLGIILAAIAGLAPLAYLTFLRAPELNPREFLDAGGASDDDTVVVVAGASSVHGIGSADFVAELRQRMRNEGYRFVNAGANGDTSADLLARVEDVIAVQPDSVAILVGTNNALGAEDVDAAVAEYRSDLYALARRLAESTDADLAFYSLQPLGENLDDIGNEQLARFNEAVAEVASESGATYLPLGETLSETIRKEGGSQPSDFSLISAAVAGARHYYLDQSWNEIGRANGYTVLVDGVHLNERGATAAADLAEEWLRGREAR